LHVLIDSTGLQVYGAGQWLEEKHGRKSRRTWRKLHLAVDATSSPWAVIRRKNDAMQRFPKSMLRYLASSPPL
jgi:hypothetical protein